MGTPKGADILATASRLNTLYVQSCRHFRIIKKVLRHLRQLWRINGVINVGFLRGFSALGTDSVI